MIQVSFNPTARKPAMWRYRKGDLMEYTIPTCITVGDLPALSTAINVWSLDPDNPQRVFARCRRKHTLSTSVL
jgi:hypothetical protein